LFYYGISSEPCSIIYDLACKVGPDTAYKPEGSSIGRVDINNGQTKVIPAERLIRLLGIGSTGGIGRGTGQVGIVFLCR
jgi:hypothetical protein